MYMSVASELLGLEVGAQLHVTPRADQLRTTPG